MQHYLKNGWYNSSNKNQITKAVIEEIIVPISCARLFDGCKSLLEIENFSNIKITHHCTSLFVMFLQCNSITNINTSDWDLCNITNIIGLFSKCFELSYIDCSKWNTSNVIYMNSVFSNCRNLKSVGNLNNWNTSNVTNMEDMFGQCYKLQALNLSNWDVSNVTTMKLMFYNSYNLKSVGDLSKWNAPRCTNAKFMFGGDSLVDKMRFTSLTLNNLFKNGIVENISCMFQKCYYLKSVGNLDDWNTSNVTDMSYAFNMCHLLKSIGNLSKWDVSNVVDMHDMFQEDYSLDNIGNLNDWNTSNVTYMEYMFNYGWNIYDDNGNAMNKEEYKKHLGINNIPTTISIPPIPKDCNISNIFLRQKFIEDIVYCGKISQSFTTKYGVAIQDNMSSLTRESIVKIINALDPENPGTLTLCEPNYEKLTDEDKAIATSKGWTIAA